MMQRLQQLDAKVFSGDSTMPARLRTVAVVAVASVALMAVIAALRDGQSPKDWLTILPALAVVVLATRVVARAEGAVVRTAVMTAGLFWALAAFGLSESVAAPIAMLLGATWTFASGTTRADR